MDVRSILRGRASDEPRTADASAPAGAETCAKPAVTGFPAARRSKAAGAMRAPFADRRQALAAAIRGAVVAKPGGHCFDRPEEITEDAPMSDRQKEHAKRAGRRSACCGTGAFPATRMQGTGTGR